MDSTRLLTGSSDSTARLWEVETGKCLHSFNYGAPCRAVSFSIDEQLACLTTDPFMAQQPAINIVRIAQDPAEQSSDIVQQLTGFSKRITRVAFTDLNAVLISAGEDGYVRRWDLEVGMHPADAHIYVKQWECGLQGWLASRAVDVVVSMSEASPCQCSSQLVYLPDGQEPECLPVAHCRT